MAFSVASAPVVNRTDFAGPGDGREFVEALGEFDIGLVHQHLETRMGEAFELLADSLHDARMAMAGVDDRDAAAEIDVALALHIPDLGIERTRGRYGRCIADAADDRGLPAGEKFSIGGHRHSPEAQALFETASSDARA